MNHELPKDRKAVPMISIIIGGVLLVLWLMLGVWRDNSF